MRRFAGITESLTLIVSEAVDAPDDTEIISYVGKGNGGRYVQD